MNPNGKCRAKHTSKQEKMKGRDDAGNPGPVYGQKDQAPNPKAQTTQTREQTEKSQENRNSKQGGASQNPGGKQTEMQSTKKGEGPRGSTKGGESVQYRPRPDGGDDHERGARRAGKSNSSQPKQHQERGEALTVLSQSTARKIRYLQSQ